MRQFEGAWSSNNSIEAGKVRLERLGYFKEVEVETVPFQILMIKLIFYILLKKKPLDLLVEILVIVILD